MADEAVAESSADFTLAVEDVEAVHRGLERLPGPYREALALRFLEEMTVDEIAQVVGCPAGTVKSRLFHGRRMLEQLLEVKTHA